MNPQAKEPCELAEIVHEKPLAGLYEERLFGSDSGNTLWVKFSDKDGANEWIGKFGSGGSASAQVEKAVEPDQFLISAGGFGYLIDATNRVLLNYHFEPSAQDIVYDSKMNRFIVADYVRLRGVESGMIAWSSKRIALDGIRNLRLQGRLVRGLAVTGYDGQESEFTFNLDTFEIKCPVDFSSWDNITTVEKLKQLKPRRNFWQTLASIWR